MGFKIDKAKERILFMKKYLRKIISLSLSLCLLIAVNVSASAAQIEPSEPIVGHTYTRTDFENMYDNVTFESQEENNNARTTYNSTLAISAHSFHMGTFRVYRNNNYSCYVGGTYNLALGYYDSETYKHYTPLTVSLYSGNSLSSTLIGSQALKFFANGEAKTAYFTNVTRGNTKRFAFKAGGDGFYANNVVMSSYA